MPKKPTVPFGHLVFSKDGRVHRKLFQLSDNKATQEKEIAIRFMDGFNQAYPNRQLTNLQQLTEDDHDFAAIVSSVPIQLELTELVDRTYTFSMSEDEYKSGLWSYLVHNTPFMIPRHHNEELRDQALTNLIRMKLDKKYAKPRNSLLWLVVFTTTPYLTEYICDYRLQVSEALLRARRFLNGTNLPFDEVWFTNLQSQPVKVWPCHDAAVSP